jgi:hypothetical protein
VSIGSSPGWHRLQTKFPHLSGAADGAGDAHLGSLVWAYDIAATALEELEAGEAAERTLVVSYRRLRDDAEAQILALFDGAPVG